MCYAQIIQANICTEYLFFILFSLFQGADGCSGNTISFHYVSPNEMYVLDFLIYHLRPYGIIANSQPLPEKLQFDGISNELNNESNSSTHDKQSNY